MFNWHADWRAESIAGLSDKPCSGRPLLANEAYCAKVGAVIETDPTTLGYGFTCWTIQRLIAHLAKETGITSASTQCTVCWMIKLMSVAAPSNLHHGIVIAVTSPTHANFNIMCLEQSMIVMAGILSNHGRIDGVDPSLAYGCRALSVERVPRVRWSWCRPLPSPRTCENRDQVRRPGRAVFRCGQIGNVSGTPWYRDRSKEET